MHDNNRDKAIKTLVKNNTTKREHLQKYKFTPGVEKNCLNCQVCFMPTIFEFGRKMSGWRSKNNTTYSSSLFHSQECEMAYIHNSIRSNAEPRSVSYKLGKGDMNKGVLMTNGEKWREAKKTRDKK